jgi:hypothetical protein
MTPDQRQALLAYTIILEAVKKRIADNERKIADLQKSIAEEDLKRQSSREHPLNRGP